MSMFKCVSCSFRLVHCQTPYIWADYKVVALLFLVFLVADVLQPIYDLAVKIFLNGDVGHGRGYCGAVPVHFIRWKPNHSPARTSSIRLPPLSANPQGAHSFVRFLLLRELLKNVLCQHASRGEFGPFFHQL